jgi:CHAT domain-containing protein/tetratricopeptide (TPR) repeat protein
MDVLGTEDLRAMSLNIGHPWSLRKLAWFHYKSAQVPAAVDEAGVLQALRDAAIRGRPWVEYARSLGQQAELLEAKGDRPRARQARLLSIAIGLEATDPSEPTRGEFPGFLENFVALLFDFGGLPLARAVAQQAVIHRRDTAGERSPDYAAALATLGRVLWRQGDRVQAFLLLERALTIRRAALGDNHPDVADDLLRLALFLDEDGERDEARRYAAEALAVHEAQIARTLPTLPERVRLALLARSSRALSTSLDLSGDDPSEAAAAYRHLIAWKGIATEAATAQSAAGGSPELRAISDRLNRAREELNRLYYAVVPPNQEAEHAQRIREQAARRDDLEARLAEALGWKPVAPDPARVAAALQSGTALVDVARYVRRVPLASKDSALRPPEMLDVRKSLSQSSEADARDEPRYAAFVIRPGGKPPRRVDLGPAEPIDRAVSDWLARVERGDDPGPPGQALRASVWLPLAPALADTAQVLVSPDGLLNLLPWGALPGGAPGSYLLDDRTFGTVIAARQLPAVRPDRATAASGGLFTVGGVDYSRAANDPPAGEPPLVAQRSATVIGDRLRFAPLAETEAEIGTVEALYARHAGGGASQNVVRLSGDSATKPRVREAMTGSRFVHLATHGYFATRRPGVVPDPAGTDRPLSHLGLLCGLVFAGANRPPNDPLTGAADLGAGIMTAEEVAGLRLRGCELAVLSACESGRGRLAGGEGVLGLQRAFHAAGARTVVASLWKVDDAATRDLMTLFYNNLWRQRLAPTEALRQAQLAMIRGDAAGGGSRGLGSPEHGPPARTTTGAHPRLWAAWVISGVPEPGQVPDTRISVATVRRRASTWPYAALGSAALVALLAWIVLRRATRRGSSVGKYP